MKVTDLNSNQRMSRLRLVSTNRWKVWESTTLTSMRTPEEHFRRVLSNRESRRIKDMLSYINSMRILDFLQLSKLIRTQKELTSSITTNSTMKIPSLSMKWPSIIKKMFTTNIKFQPDTMKLSSNKKKVYRMKSTIQLITFSNLKRKCTRLTRLP